MLSVRQFAVCAVLAVGFWLVATAAIHFLPGSFTNPVQGTLGFVTSIPVGWLCIRLTRRCARLDASQIPSAALAVLAFALSIDGIAMRFLPRVYSGDEQTCRLAAAWLLWGYGVSAFAALVMARPAGVCHPKSVLSTT